MKDFWEARYGSEVWAYGKEPNQYFKTKIAQLKPGRILLPAEGEGRNAVYAAEKAWQVTAFDLSEEARKKALSLAADRGIKIDYQVQNIKGIEFPSQSFDALGLIFAHFPGEHKLAYHHKLLDFLKPGGQVIMEAFSRDHLNFSRSNPAAGGPKDADMLFSIDEIEDLFPGFEVLELEQKEITLSEGLYHRGESSVIRFTGRKAAT